MEYDEPPSPEGDPEQLLLEGPGPEGNPETTNCAGAATDPDATVDAPLLNPPPNGADGPVLAAADETANRVPTPPLVHGRFGPTPGTGGFLHSGGGG